MEYIDLCGHVQGELSRDCNGHVMITTILKITCLLRYPHIHFSFPPRCSRIVTGRVVLIQKNLGNEGNILAPFFFLLGMVSSPNVCMNFSLNKTQDAPLLFLSHDKVPTPLGVQIALRFPNEPPARPLAQMGYHIDGIPTDGNGLEKNKLHPFNMLVGVYLQGILLRVCGVCHECLLPVCACACACACACTCACACACACVCV